MKGLLIILTALGRGYAVWWVAHACGWDLAYAPSVVLGVTVNWLAMTGPDRYQREPERPLLWLFLERGVIEPGVVVLMAYLAILLSGL